MMQQQIAFGDRLEQAALGDDRRGEARRKFWNLRSGRST